ncbi:hypothetical protein [Streptomyces sp. NPDC056844]|uniref:hypothetical protein n=1 Tax=unclassified Streptomyces TaxID=2593676 RepID=UPI0036768C25
MSQPPPWPPQQPDGRPPAQQPAQPYAPPPPQQGQPAQPYEPSQAGSGNPYGGQPVADNPYATQQPAQPQQPPQPPPYGAYPPPPQGPGTPPPPAPGKRRTPLIVGAALVALVLIGGGVWFALGTGGEDDPKGPVAEGNASASPSVSAAPSGSEETPEESPSPSVAPTPTGTGLQAVWRTSGSTMLGLGEEYLDEPARINAVLTTADGLDCEGRWQKDESGDFLEMALLCKEDGVRVKSKDRIGNLEQTGDTLSVEWKKGATGTETFERARDLEPE